MMSKTKPTVVWFQAITCNGNTHSLLSSNTNKFELFLDNFELIYHPSLTIDKILQDVLNQEEKIDFLLIEGSISSNKDFFTINEDSTFNYLNKLASKSKYIIEIGRALKNENLKNLKYQIVNLTGCPVHPEWIFQTLYTLNTFGTILLDEEARPKELYGTLAHHGCTKNEYFEWKIEGGFGQKEGCLFYEQGCRGPMTHSSCNKILWNDINSKTRVGMPCIGCTEVDFPRNDMLETKKNMGIPLDVPLGISKRAYLSITGVAKTFKIDRLHKKIVD